MSDLPIRTYIRRPEPVEAVQVTEENIEAVAEWCGIDGHHRRQSLPSRIGEMALMGHDGRMAGFWPAGLFEQVYQEQPAEGVYCHNCAVDRDRAETLQDRYSKADRANYQAQQEIELLRGLLREAADLIERDHRWIPLLDDALVCDGCGAARYPCRYERLRRRIEEALNG